MSKTRLEALTDGVFAILITIMVFDLKAPMGEDWNALASLWSNLWVYSMSFLNLAVYWNNHHHMLYITERINGSVLWANLHLLFWLSLLPLATKWVEASKMSPVPTGVYGMLLLLAGIAYLILQQTIIHVNGPHSRLRKAIGGDFKGKLTLAIYVIGIAVSLAGNSVLGISTYMFIFIIWLIPDPRIEESMK